MDYNLLIYYHSLVETNKNILRLYERAKRVNKT